MRQTENYKFNLLDGEDKLSPKPLNENMEKVDGELKGLTDSFVAEVGKRAMMAAGSYVGNGALSASVVTPGFTPRVLLIRGNEASVAGVKWKPVEFWVGQDIGQTVSAQYYTAAGTLMDTTLAVITKFTPELGKLSWELTTGSTAGLTNYVLPPQCAFNTNGVTYDWVALGYAEVEYGEA